MSSSTKSNPRFAAYRTLPGTLRRAVQLSALVPFMVAGFATAQTSSPASPLQGKIQAMQQAAAENAKRLHDYQWIETDTVTLNGTPKPPRQSLCHFTPDGKLSKTPIGSSQDSPKLSRGPLKRKIEEKKIAEVKEELAEVGNVTSSYLPLNPNLLKQAIEVRRVELEHDGARGVNSAVIHDYAKPGDQVLLTMDGAMTRLQQITVKTYLSSPADPLSLSVQFSVLPDGTSYPSLTTQDAPAKRLSVTTVSANFTRAVP
ncbi:MAG TPA: hypothetical protein VL983_11635 [Terriglobales bacterium]|nr:hypothetical protein [Terriglobales bacterium]